MDWPTVSIGVLVASTRRSASPGWTSRLSETTNRPHTSDGEALRRTPDPMPNAKGSPL
jgi:hypothetical protein